MQRTLRSLRRIGLLFFGSFLSLLSGDNEITCHTGGRDCNQFRKLCRTCYGDSGVCAHHFKVEAFVVPFNVIFDAIPMNWS